MEKELGRLLTADDIAPGDIAVLCGCGAEMSILRQAPTLAGRHWTPADEPHEESIIVDSIMRFKGLDRPVVTRASINIVRGATSVDAARLYGGYWFEAEFYCTAGWPVRNSTGTEGLLTAGHCGPPYEMNFSWNSERPVLAPAWARKDELRGYQTLDHAMYPLGRHTTTRVINIENNRVYRGETNTVPGIVTAFYEIASPRQPVRGQYLCKMGLTTGLTCGIVADINFNGDGQWNVVKVSQSAQRHIAEGRDSGGPVFSWSSDGSMVHPIGIMKRTARVNDQVCRNSSTTASNNTTCYFTFIPLTTIRAYDPFQVNTVDGFRSP